MNKVVLITGGFDPCHSGHIKYIQAASHIGNKLVVGLNSDEWLTRKKGQPFMPWEERAAVLSAMKNIDRVINFDDSDGSARDAIRKVRDIYPGSEIIFANGGDRTKENIPEMDLLKKYLHLTFRFGVGGEDKSNSSSWILQEWKAPKTERQWGYYRVLHEVPGMKVKELTVLPGKSLSMQRHEHRNEYWIVSEGTATVGWNPGHTTLKKHQGDTILRGEWHQLKNETAEPLKIVEIQYGSLCDESDIERIR
jgi:cytidyltransferase-like protein